MKSHLRMTSYVSLTPFVLLSLSTHECGHTLDLHLSYGLPVSNIEICDAVFLDHLLVLFQVALHPDTFKRHAAAARCCPVITPSASGQFSVVMISLTLNLC